MRSGYFIAVVLILLLAAAAALCTERQEEGAAAWQETPITDLVTGEAFTIAGLAAAGDPVLIQTYADWCPACSAQLAEIARLQESSPETATFVLLSPDPAADPETMQQRFLAAGVTGHAAIPPPGFSRAMIGDLGRAPFATYPSLFVVDESGNASLLSDAPLSAAGIAARLSG
ncbi:hypothetical protein FGU65_02545 [Methanoculleus sp. FWC-SCC1]|uniref:Thioredoxin domain-containing protein n=1 Tax=Methanoculleus frigidifontis TaxID=2584085 RepID=A0ABT8M785_9EURY|nr:hypothetical protein [Methanoculleus sp. FWC-SCC1]MDN7023785.1 hypothetical protein [Methanoculleus sp. FWC-SCC1]